MKYVAPLTMVCALVLCACNQSQQASLNQNDPETERLREENQELGKLRAENQEAQRLRKENQDIHKLRGEYQELARARKENDDLKKQAAKLGVAQHGTLAPGASVEARSSGVSQNPAQPGPGVQPTVNENDIPQEGDEIFVEPKFLAVILPDIDWTKLNRTEPIGIRNLLQQQGIIITNYQDLIARGITNYTIRRAPQADVQAEQPQP